MFGIVLAFWLFAQTTLNIASGMRADLGIGESWSNILFLVTGIILTAFWIQKLSKVYSAKS